MLTHLIAFGIKNQAGRNNILECYTIEYHCSNSMKREEPSSSLVDSFVDKVCWEIGRRYWRSFVIRVYHSLTISFCTACHLSLEWIVQLCIGHRATIKPNIYQVGFTIHWFTCGIDKHDIVHIRAVEVYTVIILLRIISRNESIVFQRIALHHTSLYRALNFIVEFFDTTDTLLVTIGIAPNRERRTPETRTRKVPVVEVLQPVAKASTSC